MTENLKIMKKAEQEASVLLEKGLALSQAASKGDDVPF